ncbi:MAG: GNAT family N-acetyltransferase [Anaerolineae bacterium]|nr:GNAT family N-acetyltransferase [Anaerolineae bacterium]
MMSATLFRGNKVRLAAIDPKIMGQTFSQWWKNADYARLLDSDPPKLFSAQASEKWLEKNLIQEENNEIMLAIHTLENDRLIGFVGFDGISWTHGNTWIGIGLGENEYWGQGYGTDAMRVMLRYAFTELNLHRVTLNVFAYNKRAIRSYEKTGFQVEGCERGALDRDGRRWDIIYMGILKEDWLKNFE